MHGSYHGVSLKAPALLGTECACSVILGLSAALGVSPIYAINLATVVISPLVKVKSAVSLE